MNREQLQSVEGELSDRDFLAMLSTFLRLMGFEVRANRLDYIAQGLDGPSHPWQSKQYQAGINNNDNKHW